VVDLFAGGAGDGNPANPSLGVDLTDLTSGEVSTDDMLGIAAACEKGGQDGAEGCGKVTSTDSETGKEVKLCKFTSTTTVFCDASQSPLNNTGGDANPAMCTAMDTTGGVESDCAKENGCEVTSDSYGRCVPLPHKCTTFDADECKADSDCLYNPPDKGLCVESNEVAFFNQTDAQKAKALACRCIADDSVLHFKQDQCEAAGCEFFARSGTPSEGGDVGGTATGNGGDSADGGGGEGQMCSPKDNSNSGEDIDSTIGGSDEEFDECKCIDDENAKGCAEANAGTGSSTDGNMESMSVCMGAFFKEPCESKQTKQGDKACDWSESPAQYICIGSDAFCTSADRFIMSTGQLNVTSCESNSKCSKQKVQDASGFCASHNPCTPHSGNPSACASVDGCLYTEEKRCVADLNEFAPCKETTCCYDVVGGDAAGACNAKKMVDGSRACQYYKSRGSRAFCSPKTPDALCEKVDDESITESVCNADDQCVWDEGMDIAGGNCEPFNPCTAEGVGDDETACGDLEADGEKLCLWYEDDFTEESYCVNKENAGVDNAEDLAAAILNAGDETTSGSSSCTVLFTQDNCNNAPRGDLTHPKCMYLDGQCLAYDTCRTVNAGESADNCKEAGCSWESNDPTGNNGVCKKKLGEIDSESNFECVPVDIADVSEEEVNIQFSTVKPTTTLDPKGCCVITEGLFNPEVSCEDDFSLSRCVQYGTDMMASGKWGSATLQAATTCADAAAEGVKLCPQGKTTVYVPTTSTVKTTTTKKYTLVDPAYRIFVNVQNSKGVKLLVDDVQKSITATKLLPIFQDLLDLPFAIRYDSKNAGKMFFYRAGGIEIRFPKSLDDKYRPEAKVLAAKVRKMNADATGSRRRAAVTGAPLVFLSATGAKGTSGLQKVFIAGAEDFMFEDNAVMPTAPIPTVPAVITTKQPVVAQKTVPRTTRTFTSITKTTAYRWTPRPTVTRTATTTTTVVTLAPGETSTVTSATTTTKTIDRANIEGYLNSQETVKDSESSSADAKTKTVEVEKVGMSATTIVIIIVIVVLLFGIGGLVIYRMKMKLDVTASDPNYVRGGGAAFGNPAYAPAGAAIDEANEGYLDIQEAARNAGKKKGTKKKGGLVRQESLC